MRIKTITCHDVYNVGASLQAFALAEYLKQQGHDVQIINYKPDYLRHYELTGVRNPKFDKPFLREIYQILKFPGRLKAQFDPRKKAFDDFTKEYLPSTEQVYRNNEDLSSNPPLADVYIAGSDQIWNPLFRNGKDSAFFLEFVPEGKKKISYAASFAVDFLPEENEKQMEQWLNSFDAISVRENSGVALVERMGLCAEQVCDPVFLLTLEKWKSFIQASSREPYVFLYDFDRNPKLVEIVKRLASKNHWKIVSAFPVDGVDEIAVSMGPVEFLNLIFHSNMIISNSFHATAFSIIFEKPFYVINRQEKINARMRDLLLDLELDGRLIRDFPITENTIHWGQVKEKLETIQMVSKEYLKNKLM